MRYFDFLEPSARQTLFSRPPEPFDRSADQDLLRGALGGLLYIPGTREDLASILLSRKLRDLTAMAVCLEDAVGDRDVARAEENLHRQLSRLEGEESLPLLFVRVRDAAMLERLVPLLLKHCQVLTGVILPKAEPKTLRQTLLIANDLCRQSGCPFYIMPILESAGLMAPDRLDQLSALRECTDAFYSQVLNIRIGGTDLCGLYGVRRSVDTPIYQVAAVAGFIGDVVRIFGLEDRYTISGPVWEYYRASRGAELEGLLRETALDLQNGLCGKTCIHPSQLLPVQAQHVVSLESWQDACAIVEAGGGVQAGTGKNRMNEARPHLVWARRTLRLARIYGVWQGDKGPRDLIAMADGGEASA
ncbi:MAG: HpcH/HpaI aldolase/citrate lyase family protein [Lawsonibacter sp.]|nr:HpcH/HpaI aldolase/citrate lyase family protein [Lawsonibacter sp.]